MPYEEIEDDEDDDDDGDDESVVSFTSTDSSRRSEAEYVSCVDLYWGFWLHLDSLNTNSVKRDAKIFFENKQKSIKNLLLYIIYESHKDFLTH